jgi:spermidine synthase
VRRARVPLALLFLASGFAALIYELVWFQLLELSLGSSAASIGVLLTVFMGGLFAGSAVAPSAVGARHPLRVLAALEAGIASAAMLMLWLIPAAGRLYVTGAVDGAPGLLLRAVVASVCLLPPTMAMGATLPVIGRWLQKSPQRAGWLGALYSANTLGAAAGCVIAGFYLLRVHDVVVATAVAAAVDLVAAIGALALAAYAPASASPFREAKNKADMTPPRVSGATAAVLTSIAISGFCALAGEVLWTRLLALAFGATVYTFSIVLAVFLIGIALGGSIGSLATGSITSPRHALGWTQLCVVGAVAWTAYMLARAVPYWPIIPAVSPDIVYNLQLDFGIAVLALLPAPLLWGASFPLALAAIGDAETDGGWLASRVYAANTAGAIAGAVLASVSLVAWIGSAGSQQVMMAAAGVAAVVLFGVSTRAAFAVVVTAALIATVPGVPDVLVAYGRNSASWVGHTGDILFVGEGVNASVAVSRLPGGALTYHNAGKIQASSQPEDMRLQRMLGHVTTLVPANPESVLVIGCGSGVTAGAASIDPAVKQVTIVELESLVPRVVATYFADYNFHVLDNPRVRVRIDDGRHFLLTTGERFDAITADPFDPWVRGAANLYTKEFFESAKAHLKPGGVVTMWVPLYTTTADAVKSQLATFFAVFPDAFVLGNTRNGKGYDVIVVGQRDATPISLSGVDSRLRQPSYSPIAMSLTEVGIRSVADLFFNSYASRAADLKPWLAGAPLNRDLDLRLQYLAGLGINTNTPESIYADIVRHRASATAVFTTEQ